MDIYICSICGHEYNPEKGEISQKIPAGTAFDQLPADWVCPVCGAKKGLFNKA